MQQGELNQLPKEPEEFFDEVLAEIKELRIKKEADYGRAWLKMRPIGITDIIYVKVERIKSFENKGQLNFESVEDSLRDIINYSLFELYKLEELREK